MASHWWNDFIAKRKGTTIQQQQQQRDDEQQQQQQLEMGVSPPDMTQSYHALGQTYPSRAGLGRTPYPSFYGTLSSEYNYHQQQQPGSMRSRYDSVLRYYDANYCTTPVTPVAAYHSPFQTAHPLAYNNMTTPAPIEEQQHSKQHSKHELAYFPSQQQVDTTTTTHPNAAATTTLHNNNKNETPSPNHQFKEIPLTSAQDNVSCASTVVPIHTTMDEKAKALPEQEMMRREAMFKSLRQRRVWFPFFSYLSAIGMVVVFVISVINNRSMTGNVFETSPFNMMLGPSTQALVQVGAHYAPCMRSFDDKAAANFVCPNQTDANNHGPTMPDLILTLHTSNDNSTSCPIQEICGMSHDAPNQLYRIVTALFVHSGIVHLFINMLVHLGIGRRIERRLNPIRYGFVWCITGTVGYVTSTTFSPAVSATMGCSASLFGVTVLLLVDLVRSWGLIPDAGWELFKLICLTALGLGYGYLPGPDNFAHVGGLIAGLLMAVIVMPTADTSSRARRIFLWMTRLVAFVLLIVACYLLLDAFYKGKSPKEVCSWCKFLACLPVGDMCNAYDAI